MRFQTELGCARTGLPHVVGLQSALRHHGLGVAGDMLLAQHEAIYEAIMAGNPAQAREAAQAHIDFIITATRDAERSGEWARISQLRMQQRDRQG